MKKILAVLDEDCLYAQHLTDYLNQKKKLPFYVVQFTSEEAFLHYADKQEISLLLISPDSMSETIKSCKIRTVVYLTDMEGKNEWDSCRAVYKYQSAENVVKELFACYDDLYPSRKWNPMGVGTCKMIGIYAPYGGSKKTTFSFLLGVILAEKYRVLYLSMEGFSGFTKWFHGDVSYDLSDMLYYGNLENDVWKDGKKSFLQEYKGLKWIPPVCYPEDREYLTKENTEKLLKGFLESGEFDRIVIDIADNFFFASNVLELCHEIYIPVKEDIMSQWKLQEFEEWLERSQKKEIKEKITKIHLPQISGWRNEGDYWEQFLSGEMGEYVRNLIQGERV